MRPALTFGRIISGLVFISSLFFGSVALAMGIFALVSGARSMREPTNISFLILGVVIPYGLAGLCRWGHKALGRIRDRLPETA